MKNESPAAARCIHSSWTLCRCLLQVCDHNPDLVNQKTPADLGTFESRSGETLETSSARALLVL